MKYKIGIDFTYIMDNKVTGIKKYGEEIVEGLTKVKNDYEIVLFVNEYLQQSFKEKFPKYKIIPVKFWLRNIRYVRRINALSIIKRIRNRALKKEKCDVIMHPYVTPYTFIEKKQNTIVGILDLIPLDEIENKKSYAYNTKKKQYVQLMNKSKYITTISKYTKKRLLEINSDYNGKIAVIPSSVSNLEKSDKDVYEIIGEKGPYIFCINSFLAHKNQITLLKAFNNIKEKIPHNLILVGRPESETRNSRYKLITEYIEENNLKNRVKVFSFISDEDRNALFYNADLFVTTSMQEGFGRTPVEAALCKVPVISTKETALPEATMNEVFYYENARDEKELAQKILEVLANRPTEERLEQIAKKFEKEYSKERIAKQYIELIDEVLKE